MASDVPLENPCKRLGDILVSEGIISDGQLKEGLKKREVEGGFLGKVLVELGYLTEHDLTTFLVKQFKIPHINLMDYEFNDEMLSSLPKDICLKHSVLPIDKLGRILTVAMVDPLDSEALKAVREASPELRIKPILCSWRHYEQVVRKVFADEVAAQGEASGGETSADSFGLSATSAKTTKKAPAKKKKSAASRKRMAGGASAPLISELLHEAVDKFAQEKRPIPKGLESAESLIEAIEDTIQESMKKAAESTADRLQELIFSADEEEGPGLDDKELLSSIRNALQKSMEGAAGTILYQARSALEQIKTDAADLSSQQLAELIRISMRQAVQDASMDIVRHLAQSLSNDNPF